MVGTSITGDIWTAAEPLDLTSTASSSLGTPTYIAQNGGAFMPSGVFINPAYRHFAAALEDPKGLGGLRGRGQSSSRPPFL